MKIRIKKNHGSRPGTYRFSLCRLIETPYARESYGVYLMTPRTTNPLKTLLHPYLFVLKEGGEIKKDFLDYSLMMLFIYSGETIKSPNEDEVLIQKALKSSKKQSL